MCSRDCSTASCWYWLILRRVGRGEDAADAALRASASSLICPSAEQRQLLELLLSVICAERVDLRLDALRSAALRGRCSARLVVGLRRGRRPPPTPTAHDSTTTAPRSSAAQTIPVRRMAASPWRGTGGRPRSSPMTSIVQARRGSRPNQSGTRRRREALMRVRSIAAVAALLRPRPGRRRPPHRADCDRLRAAHLGVVRGDGRHAAPGCRPTSLNADGTTSVQTSTTNIGAYMWSAVAAAASRAHHARSELVDPADAHDRRRSSTWSATATPASTTTGTTTATGAKLTVLAAEPSDEFHPILSSVDNGWLAVGLRIVQHSVPAAVARARARCTTRWTSASTTAGRNRVLFHYRPDDPVGVALLLRHRRQREPDRRLHRHRPRPAAAEGVLRALAHVPGHLRLELAGDPADRRDPHLLRRAGLRGRLPVQRHAGHAVVGRQHVRGADARPVRARGDAGRRTAGASTTRSPCDAQIHHGMVDAGYGVLGLLAVQHARGRLRRLRRRRDRDGPQRQHLQRGPHDRRPRLRPAARRARSPTRRRPRTPTASSRRTPRSSALRFAPDATLADLRALARPVPGHVRQVGLPRQRQRRDAARRPAPTSRSTRG